MYQVTYAAPECAYELGMDEFETEQEAQEWSEHVHQTRNIEVQMTNFNCIWTLKNGVWL